MGPVGRFGRRVVWEAEDREIGPGDGGASFIGVAPVVVGEDGKFYIVAGRQLVFDSETSRAGGAVDIDDWGWHAGIKFSAVRCGALLARDASLGGLLAR